MADPACRFDHGVSAVATCAYAVPHAVVPQLLRQELAAFMPTDLIVVRSHADKLCCVVRATFTGSAPLGPADIEYLAAFPYLVRLSLAGKDIDAASLALVAKLTDLQHLNLEKCKGADAAGLAEVAKLTQLRHLNLSWCGVDATGLAEVAKLTRLQHLDLSTVGATGFDEVAKLTALQSLNLGRCSVDAAGLAQVAKLTHLQSLNLGECAGVDDRDVKLPNVLWAESGAVSLVDFGLACPCGDPSATAVGTLHARAPEVDTGACATAAGAAGLAQVARLTRLQRLGLWDCEVDAAGLAEVAKLTRLQHLDVSECNGVDAAGLAEIAKLTRLQHLNLSGCSRVGAADLTAVAKLPALRIFRH